MKKFFNVNGSCNPQIHYMIDLSERLSEIKKMVDAGEYFTINRARQYGKTTLLAALAEYLKSDYKVISLDFQTISYGDFENEEKFVAAFSNEILISEYDIPEDIRSTLLHLADGKERNVTLSVLFRTLLQWCRISEKPLVLIIDEVDTATNNQVFVDFLAQLRAYYLRRMQMPTFRSVILAGVYDVRNVKSKIRPEENHKTNSPWNIAAKFKIDMNFSVDDISGMLNEYEQDYQTGMDVVEIAEMIYSYTSGYPYLVSCLCKMIDEDIKGESKTAWSKQDVLTAVKMLLNDKNPLFESLIGKLNEYPGVKNLIYRLLFRGENIGYNPDDSGIDMAEMFGFIKVRNGNVYIANRIFETRLYNMFLMSTDEQEKDVYREGARLKNQFIHDGALDMWRILENLFGNILKYAMENTRVYAEVLLKHDQVIFTLKNISAQPLNIPAEELTERFIRGDVARNTEGSGLGLSIAQSLTQLQGGTFELYLDGDLFKVCLKFPQKISPADLSGSDDPLF